MKKYPTITQNNNGWSDWIKPIMKGYRIACCDCGLVHNMEFKVIKEKKVIKRYSDGSHSGEFAEVDNPKYQISLRAGRNNRATAQIRRNKKKKKR
jgi:hypothetical protein